MMDDKSDQALRKLIDTTESGDLKWESLHGDTTGRNKNSKLLSPIYLAKVNDRTIAVYKEQTETWVDELNKMMPNEPRIVVEFVKSVATNLETEWEWPAPKYRWELFDAIQYQISGAEDFFETYLTNSH